MGIFPKFLQSSQAVVLALLVFCMEGEGVNMNGEYKVSNSDSYSTNYTTEYFDVYSPLIRTRYSEVYWAKMEDVKLPKPILDRFSGKTMAITGYEVDQVMRINGKDVSVPITWAYNHHYGVWLLNDKKARLVYKVGPRPKGYASSGHNDGQGYWDVESVDGEFQNEGSNVPKSQWFSEGNGGEFRKSYHGYPKGYAQLIDSPNVVSFFPMQIDTWNREMVDDQFKPGPLPKSSKIPASAGYSGLIECPCTDRLEKKRGMTYTLSKTSKSGCKTPVQTSTECYKAAKSLVSARMYNTRKRNVSNRPSGCSVEMLEDGTLDITWYEKIGKKMESIDVVDEESLSWQMGMDKSVLASATISKAQVQITVEITEKTTRDQDFGLRSSRIFDLEIGDHGAGKRDWESDGTVKITMTGDAGAWFGVGFGSDSMCLHMEADQCLTGGPYAIIVSGEDVVERKLDYHGAGQVLSREITVQSNQVKNGRRTVVLTRPLTGKTSDHFTFDVDTASLSIISAKGCGLHFAQHCGHTPWNLDFVELNKPTDVCQAGVKGTLGGNVFNENNRCAPYPMSELLTQKNPTCFLETYQGGLQCCRHMKPLLDKDQEIPWNKTLDYHLKFRVYYEEYNHQKNLERLYWQTEAHAGEYDIPQCEEGTLAKNCVHVLTSRFKVCDLLNWPGSCPKDRSKASKTEGVEIIYAGPHCHAPSCLSMELYNADTGKLLCHVEPYRGSGAKGKMFDEHKFISLPPCLWGSKEEGLEKPLFLSMDTNLLSIKRNNNTLGHTGEMASWQMRGVLVRKDV